MFAMKEISFALNLVTQFYFHLVMRNFASLQDRCTLGSVGLSQSLYQKVHNEFPYN